VDAPSCARDCRLRYRVRVAEAARALRDFRRALDHGGLLVAAPSSWLLRPLRATRGDWRLEVEAGTRFVTGLFPRPGGYGASLGELPESPYSAFGEAEVAELPTGAGRVQLAIAPGARALGRAAIVAWAERAVRATTAVYGRFPVPHVLVVVLPGGRRPVGFGTTLGNGGASILVWLGAAATEDDLRRDWVLTHEMLHVGLPNLPRDGRWLEEGLATYLEPLARARLGLLTPGEVWAGFVRGMPRGLRPSAAAAQGDVWGPIYWGGALFWLTADVALRTQDPARSLEAGLRDVRAAGGSIAVSWPVERFLRVLDGGRGSAVSRLYRTMSRPPFTTDLDLLWKRLGIVPGPPVSFDESAALARVRRDLTSAGRASAGG
jgi:hypothetical protein